MEEWEKLRNSTLFEIGNMLHDDVPVSNDEVRVDWYCFVFGIRFVSIAMYCHAPNVHLSVGQIHPILHVFVEFLFFV